MDQIVQAAPDVELIEVRDEVLEMHQKVARAVARVALDQGLNRDDLTGYFD